MNQIHYFDNAATTFPKPEEVYNFTDKFYRECGVNVGRGQYSLAAKASVLIEDTREMLLDLLHCPNKKIVFTHTATEALNVILQGLIVSSDYTVYSSPFEHNAVTRVLAYLQRVFKINVITLAVNKSDLCYDLAKIKYQFAQNKPNLVVISHASNVCGLIAPIHAVCAEAKLYGATTVIDMCQTAGLIDTNISSDNIDFAVFAGHKTLYGPLGAAGFACSNSIKPEPLLYGGTGIDSVNQNMPETIPERYEVASPNIMALSGLYAALKWIRVTGIKQINSVEERNHIELLRILGRYNNIRIIGPANSKLGIGVVSCIFDGYSSDSIGKILSDNAVAVRTGLHCAPYAHKFLGTFPAGTVRFSVGYFNTKDDFQALEHVLENIAEYS